MEIILTEVQGRPTNKFYDPDKANNGGGYWQYDGSAVAKIGDKTVRVEVCDDSCGDFGTRYAAIVTYGIKCWYLAWGSMDGVHPDRELYRDISLELECSLNDLLDRVFDAVDAAAWKEMRGHEIIHEGGWHA